jgi:hypothetical protein
VLWQQSPLQASSWESSWDSWWLFLWRTTKCVPAVSWQVTPEKILLWVAVHFWCAWEIVSWEMPLEKMLLWQEVYLSCAGEMVLEKMLLWMAVSSLVPLSHPPFSSHSWQAASFHHHPYFPLIPPQCVSLPSSVAIDKQFCHLQSLALICCSKASSFLRLS